MRTRGIPGRERGQMTVEFAVVLPVVIAVMVIAVDCMVFAGQCARFDNIAAQRVIALGVSAGRESYELEQRAADIEQALADDFANTNESVEVSCERAEGGLGEVYVFCCTLRFAPWPLSEAGASVFGTTVPLYLTHEYELAIDPYTPGDL